jgi:hypothetical protein
MQRKLSAADFSMNPELQLRKKMTTPRERHDVHRVGLDPAT